MELKWLEDFLSLCNTGNFRESSEQRFVSQPAFSRRIRSLENWLGADLFDRTRYPVCLSEAGLEFKPIAEQIVRLSEQARSDVAASTRVSEHSLNIATLLTLAQFFVPSMLEHLRDDPVIGQINIRTDFRSVEDYLDGLESRLVDFFICYDDASGSNFIDGDKFPKKRLGLDELVLVSKPDADGQPIHTLPESGSCSLLHYNRNAHLFRPIRNHSIRYLSHVEFFPTHQATTTAVLRALCLLGRGMAWLPRTVVVDDLEAETLVPVTQEFGRIQLEIMIYRHKDNNEPHVDRIWNLIPDSP